MSYEVMVEEATASLRAVINNDTLEGVPIEEVVKDCTIDTDDFEASLLKSPHAVLLWAGRASNAKFALDEANLEYRIWRDGEIIRLTSSLEEVLGKKPSQARVEQELRTLDSYKHRWQDIHLKERQWSLCVAVQKACEMATAVAKVLNPTG